MKRMTTKPLPVADAAVNTDPIAPTKARYLMIGGFLGAGKTTAVGRLAQHFTQKGLRVGLITNDQGSGLVDTTLLRARGFATEEIPGGCFCCRFNSLMEAATRLTTANRPDVFIAEPVGSCTDLVATVTYPLRRIYGESFAIAPLSVLVDPVRAGRVLGLEAGARFSEKVVYIYRKQLEEANLIVINKSDLLDDARREGLRDALTREFPRAEILSVSARTGAGLEPWLARLGIAEQSSSDAMPVDYDLYAEGEALLGWLNATIQLASVSSFEAGDVLTTLARGIQETLQVERAEIAHLKMTLSPDAGLGGLAVVNLVRNDFVPELSQELEEAIPSGQLILNLRAEGAPEILRQAVETALANLPAQFPGISARLDHLERFRPGRPTPTHRLTSPN